SRPSTWTRCSTRSSPPSSAAKERASAFPSPPASCGTTAGTSTSPAHPERERPRRCCGPRSRRRAPPMAKLRALVVDDVVDMAQTNANALESAGFKTEVAWSGAAALERFALAPADVVVTDLRMKGVDGLDLLSGIKRSDPTVPAVTMAAFGAIESAVESMRRGAFHYITKPFELGTLRALVERACRERALSSENALLRRTLRASLSSRQLLGESLAMRQLRALIDQVAHAPSSVL